jgi:hypothetical protein
LKVKTGTSPYTILYVIFAVLKNVHRTSLVASARVPKHRTKRTFSDLASTKPESKNTFGWQNMIRLEMLGSAILLLGILLVAIGTAIYNFEPPRVSQNSYCDGSYCIEKIPIYCYKTLHGMLFDTGWLLILAGSIILLFGRIRRLRQVAEDRRP